MISSNGSSSSSSSSSSSNSSSGSWSWALWTAMGSATAFAREVACLILGSGLSVIFLSFVLL